MTLIQSLILSIVEGITEFLPISSTGHLIIASSIMGIASDPFTKAFTVAIQFGAILSVVVLYFRRFFQSINFYKKLFVAFIPAAILGKLLSKYIDMLLENVIAVGISTLVGGIILVFVDSWFNDDEEKKTQLSYPSAFKVGLFQTIAMIPGVSRSAATIIGGLTQKLTRRAAAEFSFFLAVPTMFAATCYKLYEFYYKTYDPLTDTFGHHFEKQQLSLLIIGNIIAFAVAMLAIKTFINYLSNHGFKVFGYYRIVVGLTILVLYYLGIPLSTL